MEVKSKFKSKLIVYYEGLYGSAAQYISVGCDLNLEKTSYFASG